MMVRQAEAIEAGQDVRRQVVRGEELGYALVAARDEVLGFLTDQELRGVVPRAEELEIPLLTVVELLGPVGEELAEAHMAIDTR